VTITGSAGRIEVNGVPCEAREMTGLVRQFQLHGVSAIAVPLSPPPGQLYELIRVLADPPGRESIAARLRSFGADQVRVTLASSGLPVAPPSPGTPPVPPREGFAAPEPVLPSPDAAAAPPSRLGPQGIRRGDAL